MAIFNLRKASSNYDGDDHIEHKLKKEHKPQKDNVTEKQLDNYRAEEPNNLTEKQLEKNRGGPEGTIEARLNSSSSKLMKHRDESTHIGDINKLEEQRLANKPVEKETYELASETPKKLRWWEDKSSPDNLKLAQRYEPAFEGSDFSAFDEEGELNSDFMEEKKDFDLDVIDDGSGDFLDDEEDEELDDEFDLNQLDGAEEIFANDYEEASYEQNVDLGIVRGKIRTQEDIEGNELAINDLINYLVDKHPELEGSLTESSFDFAHAEDGIVRYLVRSGPSLEASSKKRTVEADLPSKKK